MPSLTAAPVCGCVLGGGLHAAGTPLQRGQPPGGDRAQTWGTVSRRVPPASPERRAAGLRRGSRSPPLGRVRSRTGCHHGWLELWPACPIPRAVPCFGSILCGPPETCGAAALGESSARPAGALRTLLQLLLPPPVLPHHLLHGWSSAHCCHPGRNSTDTPEHRSLREGSRRPPARERPRGKAPTGKEHISINV